MSTNDQNRSTFVAVPCRNHGRFIEKCLRSVIEQSLPPQKLLVIDDGSTDGSPSVIDGVLKDCPFEAELIVRENRGLCATLNQALELSFGEYFAYIGSDDYWLPGFIAARTLTLSQRPSAVLAYGHADFVNEDGTLIGSTAASDGSWGNYVDGDARKMLLDIEVPISSTVFYRRAALSGLQWNEEAKLEDFEMYIQLAATGDFAFDPSVLAVWRKHSHNTSGDLHFMLNEVLAIQERNAGALGLGEGELEKLHRATKFKYARDLLQNGDKLASLRLAADSLGGQVPPMQLLRFALRQFVPMAVVKSRRASRRQKLLAQRTT